MKIRKQFPTLSHLWYSLILEETGESNTLQSTSEIIIGVYMTLVSGKPFTALYITSEIKIAACIVTKRDKGC